MVSREEQFIEAARRVGAEVVSFSSLDQAAAYIGDNCSGKVLVPATPLESRHNLRHLLSAKGVEVHEGSFRQAGLEPEAGVTFSNFVLADTGTVVLESTDENIRLATTLPTRHFVLVDPAIIYEDNLAAATPMTELHKGSEPQFIAYITGPSRTADIERVLTIGCHGPKELHILVVEGLSNDPFEN